MLKFFRKIRQQLLAESKFSKYLIYALGEIVLVVIGILIAVQINDWNEDRKAGIRELKVLKNLKEDIRHNASRLKEVYSYDSLICERNKTLLRILQEPRSEYHDSLQVYFGTISRYDVFAPRRMAYEALKSEGLELISNEELRSAIILLYDESYLLNTLVLDMRREIHITSNTLLTKRFFTQEQVGFRMPNDFNALKTDSEFLNNLSYILAEGGNFLRHYRNILSGTQSVEAKIAEEISNRSPAKQG
jgi:hypothetical protein